MEPLQCGVGVVALQCVLEIHREPLCARTVFPSITAPAASVGPSVPSVPIATTHTLARPAISRAAAAANSCALPPVPFPVTVTVVSPRPPHNKASAAVCPLAQYSWPGRQTAAPRLVPLQLKPAYTRESEARLSGHTGHSPDGRFVIPDDMMMDSSKQRRAGLGSLARESLTSTIKMLRTR